MNIADIRKDYTRQGLSEKDALSDPFAQFQQWFDQAMAANVPEPNAMTLATCTPDGTPSARIVLLKGFDQRGLQFFTNYLSRKGHELLHNPRGAVVFFWPDLERQVRIEGLIGKVTPYESEQYFHSRPRNSRLGAWASEQSRVIPNAAYLEARQNEFDAVYGNDVPRPEHWGGYRLAPTIFEFWQGRPSRLHDRLRYRLIDGMWVMDRLSP